MKLTINEKIGFGAGDMAIAIVMMSLAMIITFLHGYIWFETHRLRCSVIFCTYP